MNRNLCKKGMILGIIFLFFGASLAPNIMALKIENDNGDPPSVTANTNINTVNVGDVYVICILATGETWIDLDCNNFNPIDCTGGKTVQFCAGYSLDAHGSSWAKGSITLFVDGILKEHEEIEVPEGNAYGGSFCVEEYFSPSSIKTTERITIVLKASFKRGLIPTEKTCSSSGTLSYSQTYDIMLTSTGYSVEITDDSECPCQIKENTRMPILLYTILEKHPHLFPLIRQILGL